MGGMTIVRSKSLQIALSGIVTAGLIGTLGAKYLMESSGFNAMGFLPPMSIYWSTVFTGIAIAAVLGAVSGFIPAWQAANLRIVDALRRVD